MNPRDELTTTQGRGDPTIILCEPNQFERWSKFNKMLDTNYYDTPNVSKILSNMSAVVQSFEEYNIWGNYPLNAVDGANQSMSPSMPPSMPVTDLMLGEQLIPDIQDEVVTVFKTPNQSPRNMKAPGAPKKKKL